MGVILFDFEVKKKNQKYLSIIKNRYVFSEMPKKLVDIQKLFLYGGLSFNLEITSDYY